MHSVSKSRGLALLWKKDIKVDVQMFLGRHIDAIISRGVGDKLWRFTGFYDNSKTSKKEEFWERLELLERGNSLP